MEKLKSTGNACRMELCSVSLTSMGDSAQATKRVYHPWYFLLVFRGLSDVGFNRVETLFISYARWEA